MLSVLEIDQSNILMCGDRFGTLKVYIHNKIDERALKKIKEAIDTKLKTMKHKYVTHIVSSEINQLNVTGGMQIHFNNSLNSHYGTLGGFALRENDQTMYALLSKHVAIHLGEFHLGQVCANVITPHTDKLDIATAKLTSENNCKVDTDFKDIYDRRRKCTLFKYINGNPQALRMFEMVFIRGGTTRIGQGELVCSAVQQKDYPLLRIKNRADTPDKDFCKPGDSGAIVCSTTRDGLMYALAMVVGKDEQKKDQKEYIACMLMDGLEELSKTHKCTYRLCEGSSKT